MKLKRRFYDASINLKNISRERLVLGVVIGLVSAITIYHFAYLLRELFRLMSNGFGHLPNILSESERRFYNWFFAALSLVFGNSIAIVIIFGGTNHYFGKRQFKNRRIINDQIFLNSSFAYLFLKICFVIGVFSMSFTDFNFLPEFKYFIILLVIVLYLETWKTLSLIFKKHRFKYILIHFLILFFSSYLLSNLEIVNYQNTDNNQLKFKPITKLPKSNFDNVSWRTNYIDVFLKDKNEGKLSFGYYENDLNNIYLDFLDFKLKLNKRFQDNSAIRISANKDEKMSRIKYIESQVRKAKIPYIIFGTFEQDIHAKRFSNAGIIIKLSDSTHQEDNILDEFYLNKPHFYKMANNLDPKVTLKIRISEKLTINDSIIPNNLLIQKFQQNINENTLFQYEFNSNTEYQNYITVLSSHLKAIKILREKHNKVKLKWDNEKFKYTNKEQFMKEQQRLRFKFPFYVTEKYN
ncbi:MAG: hypothetical protein ABJK28_04410 [Algibacter sp.]